MLEYFISGSLFGASAGIAPGPLLTLVVAETLKYNRTAGIKIALAPMVTDAPIIILSLLLLEKISRFYTILGGISIIGGFLVLYLGYESLRAKGMEIDLRDVPSHSFAKGILVNALNPHPYLFWFTVGGPMVMKAMNDNIFSAASFIGGFYLFLVGTKVVLAVAIGRHRDFLSGRAYIYAMRFLGVLLCLFSLLLFKDGLELTGFL